MTVDQLFPEPKWPREVRQRVQQFLRAVDDALAAAGAAPDERRAVVQDLGAQVYEMLAERVNGGEPTVADVDAVLAQLDPPAAYGERAADAPQPYTPPKPAAANPPPAPRRPHPHHPARPSVNPPLHLPPSRRSFDLHGIMDRVLGGEQWPHIRRFTDRARRTRQFAEEEARRLGHDYLGTEHVLIGLSRDTGGLGSRFLIEHGIDLGRARSLVAERVRPGLVPYARGHRHRLPPTPRLKAAVDAARIAAEDLRHNYVGTEHLLIGLLDVPDGLAGQILREHGLTREAVVAEVLRARNETTGGEPPEPCRMRVGVWPPGTGRTVALAGTVFTTLAAGEDTAGAHSLFELTLPPGATLPAHRDLLRDWSLVVTDGEFRVDAGDRTTTAAAGAFVAVPKGTPRTLHNVGPIVARAVVVTTPPGLEHFLNATGVQVARDGGSAEWGPEQERRLREVGPTLGIVLEA